MEEMGFEMLGKKSMSGFFEAWFEISTDNYTTLCVTKKWHSYLFGDKLYTFKMKRVTTLFHYNVTLTCVTISISFWMLQFCCWRYVTEPNVTFVTKRVTSWNTSIHVDSWKIEPVRSCNKYWCRAKLALRFTRTKSLHAAKILATKILILVIF